MTPTTPSGVATRSMTSPFGRVNVASTRPTGSGKSATSSSPRAIASIRTGSRASRSIKAGLRVLRASLGEIERVGGQNLGRALAQEPRRGMKRAVLRLRRRVGELTRRGARLPSDFAHGGADVGFGLFDLDGDGHDGGTGLFTLNLADEARFRHDFPSSHAFGRNAWQNRGLVSSRAPPMRSMQ